MKIFFFIVLMGITLGVGSIADAQTYADGIRYEPVVQIPGLDPNTQGTDQYVNALYMLAITVAAFLAVVKIIFGGVKWMLSDVVTDKSSAKKDMWGAILGLLIVLSTVLVLETINPNLKNLNFLENADPISITLSNNKAKSACEVDANSAACCQSKGGAYITEGTSGRCTIGNSVTLPSDVQGDDTQSRVICVGTYGGIWTGTECVLTSGREIPIPGMETNDDENDIAQRCQRLGGNYDRTSRKCIQI